MSDRSLAARARAYSETLVGWPSVTGTPDEAQFPHRLAELIGGWDYFRDSPQDLVVQPIEGDPNGRSNVIALVRGTGSRTVILSGHFDVVPVDDYTDLAPLAGKPQELTAALIARLEAQGGYPQALDDLKSGAFLPGRGMLDMKSGVAAGMAVLQAFSEQAERKGNLLLVATPDEEENSCGMRGAATFLPRFLRDRGLDVPLAINLDATCDPDEGQNGRVVTMGTIGKLLLSAFVVGKDSHACYPFDGVNAAYLAAELAVEFEGSPDLGEVTNGEIASPPTALSSKDGKSVYNVTTPGRAWLFWNVLIHNRTPADILAIARRKAEEAVARAGRRMTERAAGLDPSIPVNPFWQSIRVLTFAELRAIAEQQPGFGEAFAREATRLAKDVSLDVPTRSRVLTEFTVHRSGLEGAAVILGNASMPYPAIKWQPTNANRATEAAIEAGMAEIAARENLSIEKRAFFPAISDMSFLGPQDVSGLEDTAANTPLWGSSINWDLAGEAAAIPIINIGPWGRDYHHWLERTHIDYTFRVLPELVQAVAHRVLKA